MHALHSLDRSRPVWQAPFVCSDLNLEESLSLRSRPDAAAKELHASFPSFREGGGLAFRHIELERRLPSSKEGLDVLQGVRVTAEDIDFIEVKRE
jgi:hypothetical protein